MSSVVCPESWIHQRLHLGGEVSSGKEACHVCPADVTPLQPNPYQARRIAPQRQTLCVYNIRVCVWLTLCLYKVRHHIMMTLCINQNHVFTRSCGCGETPGIKVRACRAAAASTSTQPTGRLASHDTTMSMS